MEIFLKMFTNIQFTNYLQDLLMVPSVPAMVWHWKLKKSFSRKSWKNKTVKKTIPCNPTLMITLKNRAEHTFK